jgi:hypothetical protein
LAEELYEEEDIEESIREELEESANLNRKKKKRPEHEEKDENQPEQDGNRVTQFGANPFSTKRGSDFKMSNATPNTIMSNKQKLNRGVSRDSDHNFNNGTMLNFGLAG